MIRRLALLLLPLAAILALSSGCGEDTPATPEDVSLVLDWFPNANHAGIYAAQAEGFFADAALRVDVRLPSDTAAAIAQVAAGKADFAVSYEPEILIARSQGIPVTAVGALVTKPLNSVMARTDRGIARPRDLAGKTVGIAGVPSDRALLDAVVRADGGDPSKVKTRNVGFNLETSLAAGRVDAVIGTYWNVEGVTLPERGVDLSIFRLDQHGVPQYDELVIVASDDTVKQRPEIVRSLLAGLARGQAWAAENQDAAVAHLAAANPDLDRALAATSLRLVAPLLAPGDAPPLALSPEEWQSFAAWMTENKLLAKPVDVEAAVSPGLAPGG